LVVVIDCTEIGAPPPTATAPTWICLVSRRFAEYVRSVTSDSSPFHFAASCVRLHFAVSGVRLHFAVSGVRQGAAVD
jgi:iron only hydrogenase large subunit-like protein